MKKLAVLLVEWLALMKKTSCVTSGLAGTDERTGCITSTSDRGIGGWTDAETLEDMEEPLTEAIERFSEETDGSGMKP